MLDAMTLMLVCKVIPESEGPIATLKWDRFALMADPFGHGFCFVQFLGAGYDEIAE